MTTYLRNERPARQTARREAGREEEELVARNAAERGVASVSTRLRCQPRPGRFEGGRRVAGSGGPETQRGQ